LRSSCYGQHHRAAQDHRAVLPRKVTHSVRSGSLWPRAERCCAEHPLVALPPCGHELRGFGLIELDRGDKFFLELER
jgi:hypothetical protein